MTPALDHEAGAARSMWSSVVLHTLNDYWTETLRANGDPAAVARIRSHALHYFSRAYTRDVILACAGIDATPEQLADMAVDLTARDRTTLFNTDGRRRRA